MLLNVINYDKSEILDHLDRFHDIKSEKVKQNKGRIKRALIHLSSDFILLVSFILKIDFVVVRLDVPTFHLMDLTPSILVRIVNFRDG